MAREIRVEDLRHLQNYTIEEFSAFARISRSTVYREINDGKLRASKLRGRRIIPRAEADRYVGGVQAGIAGHA